jgi:predicted small secreted protein
MRVLTAIALSMLLTGCQMLSGLGSKIGSLGDRLNKKPGDTSGTVAGAQATAGAIDRMSEIAKREAEARRALEAQYEKFRQELAAAYANREKVDNENFDRISEVNYGIIAATEEVVGLDKRVLVANLKAKENAEMLMPVPEDKKKAIVAEIDADVKKELAEITKKYEQKTKEAQAAAKRYEEADALVKKIRQRRSRRSKKNRQPNVSVCSRRQRMPLRSPRRSSVRRWSA